MLEHLGSELAEGLFTSYLSYCFFKQILSTEQHTKGQGCLCSSLLSIEHNLSVISQQLEVMQTQKA